MDLRLINMESEMMWKYGLAKLPRNVELLNTDIITSALNPAFLKSSDISLVNIGKTPICSRFSRLIICGYGAYVELKQSMLLSPIKPDDRTGDSDRREDGCEPLFINYTFDDGWHTRIRLYTRFAPYGDFVPGAFYINVGETWIESEYMTPVDWLIRSCADIAV